jgi:hypothetical protein
MTLGFKQQFPWGESTNFREKILAGVGKEIGLATSGEKFIINSWPKEIFPNPFTPKFHTFRADPHNRWKAGRKIEMVYRGAGYKILDHFNKDIPELSKCVSTQKIDITIRRTDSIPQVMNIRIDDKLRFVIPLQPNIKVATPYSDYMTLIRNDGFENLAKFFKWFKKDFSGKIIHWTDLRY